MTCVLAQLLSLVTCRCLWLTRVVMVEIKTKQNQALQQRWHSGEAPWAPRALPVSIIGHGHDLRIGGQVHYLCPHQQTSVVNGFNQKGKVTQMSYVNEKKPRLGRIASPVVVCVCLYLRVHLHTYIRSTPWNTRRDSNKNNARYNWYLASNCCTEWAWFLYFKQLCDLFFKIAVLGIFWIQERV